jgi:putative ABC transport system ATP-binding protein
MKDESKESCVLKVENVSKSYGKTNEIKAIDGITLEFNRVGMHFITGGKGSGKTTLLNIIGLLDNAYSGSIYFDNKLIDKKDTDTLRAKYYNYVFQDSNLIDDLNLEDNIKIVDLLNNQTKDIDLGNFENLKHKYPKNFLF